MLQVLLSHLFKKSHDLGQIIKLLVHSGAQLGNSGFQIFLIHMFTSRRTDNPMKRTQQDNVQDLSYFHEIGMMMRLAFWVMIMTDVTDENVFMRLMRRVN